MADIFISYKRENEDFVEILAKFFEGNGCSVWCDRRLLAGDEWDRVIARELDAAACVVVVWSLASTPMEKGRWVREEAHIGLSRGVLIPVAIEGVGPPFGFRLLQYRDLTRWDRKSREGLADLFADVMQMIRKSSPATEPVEETGPSVGGGVLNLETSLEAILKAAARRRFINYGEIAAINDADWQQVRYKMPSHLWDLVVLGHKKGWPMLSAIVVNKKYLDTGEMEPGTLKGFLGAARELGYTVADQDGASFLKEQQRKIFEWAAHMSTGVSG